MRVLRTALVQVRSRHEVQGAVEVTEKERRQGERQTPQSRLPRSALFFVGQVANEIPIGTKHCQLCAVVQEKSGPDRRCVIPLLQSPTIPCIRNKVAPLPQPVASRSPAASKARATMGSCGPVNWRKVLPLATLRGSWRSLSLGHCQIHPVPLPTGRLEGKKQPWIRDCLGSF